MIRQLASEAKATADLLVARGWSRPVPCWPVEQPLNWGSDLCPWPSAVVHQPKPLLHAGTWKRPSSSNIAYAKGVKRPRSDNGPGQINVTVFSVSSWQCPFDLSSLPLFGLHLYPLTGPQTH